MIHSAIHAARHDAGCVLHTHTLNGVAVSAQREGLLPISQQAIFVLASLGYHDYEGIAVRDDEKPRLVATSAAKLPDAAKPRAADRRANGGRSVRRDVLPRGRLHDPGARAEPAARELIPIGSQIIDAA